MKYFILLLCNCAIATISGVCFKQNGYDIEGNDLKHVPAKRAEECCKICSETLDCKAYVFTKYVDGICWLKNSDESIIAKKGAELGIFKAETTKPITTDLWKSKPKTTTEAAVTDDSTVENIIVGTIFTILFLRSINAIFWYEEFAVRYAVGCDFFGNDLKNELTPVQKCGPTCEAIAECSHFTWTNYNGGTCWMKKGKIKEESAKEKTDEEAVCGHFKARTQEIVTVTVPPPVTVSPKNLNESSCGNRPPAFRIVGGREAAPHSWPWMASILEIDGTESKHICGGSLISASTILTAAHCFRFKTESSAYKVRLGSHKLSEKDANEVEREVTNVMLHEKYTSQPAVPYDIAVLHLKEPVLFNDFVSPVCLGQPLQLKPGTTCYVLGWGRTEENGAFSDTLLELELPILLRGQCEKILGDKFEPELQICGAYENGGKDACQGDSGGPLICEDKKTNKWRLQGIVSWGKGCAKKGNPGVYTRVSYYKDWIAAQLKL